MSLYFKKLLEKAGFRRSEKRASLILVVLIFLLLLGRLIFTPGKVEIVTPGPVFLESEPPILLTRYTQNAGAPLFRFDPNKVSGEKLKLLGIPEKQVKILLNYRNKGGRFKHGTDMARIYGLDSILLMRLLPFIDIDSSGSSAMTRKDEKSFESHHTAAGISITDLNTCDSAELERLPAIGPVLASRIIRYRKLLGGFCTALQLKDVYGISDSTFRVIAPNVIASSRDVKLININKAGFADLARHPYLKRYEVQAILKFRSVYGRIDSMQQLTQNGILDTLTAEKIKCYIDFSDPPVLEPGKNK